MTVLLSFWFAGGFSWLDEGVRGFGMGPVMTGLAFMMSLMIPLKLLNLPFQLYSTFVLEARFGFNRTDAKAFWTDQVKGIVLGGLLGGALMAAILFFFEKTGSNAWLWYWATTTAFALISVFVAPTWIMPLFNTFTALDEGSLRDKILAYAKSVSFPLEGLFVIDGSKRSSKANAFFTGFGKNKRIALFDTLIDSQTEEELVAVVVAHEIVHYKRKHILQGLVIAILKFGLLFWLLSGFLGNECFWSIRGFPQPPLPAPASQPPRFPFHLWPESRKTRSDLSPSPA